MAAAKRFNPVKHCQQVDSTADLEQNAHAG